jgi:hypothetical protein
MTASVKTLDTEPHPVKRFGARGLGILCIVVLCWFALSEIGTNYWYASHEARMPKNKLPESGEAIVKRLRDFLEQHGGYSAEQEVDETTMGILKASFGRTVTWQQNGMPAAATILEWKGRNAVGGAETMHNPGKCLRAAGWKVESSSPFDLEEYGGTSCDVAQWKVSRGDFRIAAFSAVLRRYTGEPHKFETHFKYDNRLRSVIDGRRDAPAFIILAYLPLPADGDTNLVRAQFQEMLRFLL